jgi:hypothetical protein
MAKLNWMTYTGSLVAVALTGCGGGGEEVETAAPTAVQASSVTVMPSESASGAPASATLAPRAPDISAAVVAARKTAATDPFCDVAVLGDFYWEIGNAFSDTPIVSHAEGSGAVQSYSRFSIASASKFVFGAYVLEKKGIDQVRNTPSLSTGLRFLSGYTGFDDAGCAGTATVGACYLGGNATQVNPRTVGKFDYDGGHDQKLAAVDLGLANFTSRQVDQEYQKTLGVNGFNMAPLDPIMAGGLIASATDYARFMQKMMRQELEIGRHLGEDAVCTQASVCPGQVAYSPTMLLGEPWGYAYNYWVESEHGNGTVDAYSSPGKFGFYPWMTPDRKYYGVLSRHQSQENGDADSVKCGRQIRKAFLNALQSPRKNTL